MCRLFGSKETQNCHNRDLNQNFGMKHERNYTLKVSTEIITLLTYIQWAGSSVGIATDYGLDGPESNPGGARFSALPDQPWSPPSLP